MSSTAEQAWVLSSSGAAVQEFYASIGVELPGRGTTDVAVRCFANPGAHTHGDRTPSCSVSLLTGLWCCQACGMKGNAYSAAIALNYSETRARELARRYGLFLEASPLKSKDTPRLPDQRQLSKWRQRLVDSPLIVRRLGELKGWTLPAMFRCGLGWDGERLVFPIKDKKLKRVGVARYLPGGDPKMKAIPGSKRGLFPAPETLSRKRPLFVCEGEPAVVSIRSAGHQAVGIPGVGSWRPEWARRLDRFPNVIVLPDCDPQGRDLAARVAGGLSRGRVVDIEPTCTDGSDIGDWIAEANHEGGIWQVRFLLDGLAAA